METLKVLGQVNPIISTVTVLYTVPVGKQSVISSLVVANGGVVVSNFRIAVRPNGEGITTRNYIALDVDIQPKSVTSFTLGITLSATDVISVSASSGDLAFSAFGSEVE